MAKRKTKLSEMPEQVRHDGDLVANFVNTANPKRRSIGSYADLLGWGQRSGVLAASDGERLGRMAVERPADAEAVVRRTGELLRCLERILTALSRRRAPADADVETLNGFLGEALSHRRLVPAASGHRLGWGNGGGDDFDRVLWPVAVAAADVLCSKYRHKVYRCPGEGCGLFLVDRTPGKPRRWCTVCGNRHRTSKHYRSRVRPRKQAAKARSGRPGTRESEPPEPEDGRMLVASALRSLERLNKQVT